MGTSVSLESTIISRRFGNFAYDNNCRPIAYHVGACVIFKTRRFKVVRHHMKAILTAFSSSDTR